ncbi:MAG: hypothetical protein K2M62_07150 [Muribaculaceae bacterium]|nr:hypothetical protein [Muribaculaceae bacterium]
MDKAKLQKNVAAVGKDATNATTNLQKNFAISPLKTEKNQKKRVGNVKKGVVEPIMTQKLINFAFWERRSAARRIPPPRGTLDAATSKMIQEIS